MDLSTVLGSAWELGLIFRIARRVTRDGEVGIAGVENGNFIRFKLL